MTALSKEGRVFRDEKTVVVEVPGSESLLGIPGVRCNNPDAPSAERIYRKVFLNEHIYLPNEYDRAVREVLGAGSAKDVVILGMNGYSSLTEEKCRAWGVKPGAYEAACRALLFNVVHVIRTRFPRLDLRFAHGASDLGVDRVIIDVANTLNRPQLGHSCPRFMMYVLDNDVPVYLAPTQAAYSDAFIESLHVLVAANGRMQSFHHDIDAAFKRLRHVIPVNVLRTISTTGGPPAIGPDGSIEDAVAAFEQRVHLVSQQLRNGGMDAWVDLNQQLQTCMVSICRQLLSPEGAFPIEYTL